MQITSRFTIAVHSTLCIKYFSQFQLVKSPFLAESTGTNPVVIRRLLSKLQSAGFISVKQGTGGAEVVKNLSEITLFDILKAIDATTESLFKFQDKVSPKCPKIVSYCSKFSILPSIAGRASSANSCFATSVHSR